MQKNPSFMTLFKSISTLKRSVVLRQVTTCSMLKDGMSKDVSYARNTESGCKMAKVKLDCKLCLDDTMCL